MKTTALPVSHQQFPSWSGLIARLPEFIALTTPRVTVPAVFVLFAPLLADRYADRRSTTIPTHGARIDHGSLHAECLTFAVRATRDRTRFSAGEA